MIRRVMGAAAAALFCAGATQAAGGPLERYRWTSRVLVISASDGGDPDLAAQRTILAGARPGVTERDIVVLEAIGDTPDAKRLRASLGLPESAFRAVLVGKDGEAKRVAVAPMPVGVLFETIDAMPMRRDEMRR